jgi:hypothetical protein
MTAHLGLYIFRNSNSGSFYRFSLAIGKLVKVTDEQQ